MARPPRAHNPAIGRVFAVVPIQTTPFARAVVRGLLKPPPGGIFQMLQLHSRFAIGALGVVLSTAAAAGAPVEVERPAGAARVALDPVRDPAAPLTGSVCTAGPNRCHVHVRASAAGDVVPFATPVGWGAPDLQSAYAIDPSLASGATVAIVDAYGYPNLESDLAIYRARYGLPPCTRATGCLTVVNQTGQSSPLPPPPPPTDDWTSETALDVDMVSAGCPSCKILVVQTADSGDSMFYAQRTALRLGATVISNSWGQAQQPGQDLSAYEANFDHAGVATFVSSGDNGYDEGGRGPHYPSTSAYAIAVGGTRLARATTARGWSETAWTMGGSSCSLSIPKPAYQQGWPCAYRSATDISAVADPQPGIAMYNAGSGGWLSTSGTSAAAPLVAAIFAATGHGAATGSFIAGIASSLNDVTSGTNGTCGTALCNAGVGWDGPTGFGTPNAAAFADTGGNMSLAIASPAPGETVRLGFEVDVDATGADLVELRIDGLLVASKTAGPYRFATPSSLTIGDHEIAVQTYGAGGQQNDSFDVTVVGAGTGGGSGSGSGSGTGSADPSSPPMIVGGCAATGGGGGGGVALAALAVALVRRRRC